MTVEGLDGHRVAEVLVARMDGTDRCGSGYRINDSLVLTAAHVVGPPATIRVRFDADQPGEWSSPATVAWLGEDVDIAVLKLGAVPPSSVGTVRFASVGKRPVRVDVHLMGYPRWKLRRGKQGGSVREGHHAVGTLSA